MSTYTQEPCEFIYRVSSLEKVVDGDTIDVSIDLGFDVCTKQRVRLLGIDTPESRTRDLTEKKFGLLSKKKRASLRHDRENDIGNKQFFFLLNSLNTRE